LSIISATGFAAEMAVDQHASHAKLSPMLSALVLALNEIARCLLTDAPDVAAPGVADDVDRYLRCGGDFSTATAIEKQDAKAFLYLVHETVELHIVRPCLDTPAPPPKAKPAIPPRPQDPWIRAIGRCRNRGCDDSMSPMFHADAVARGVEIRLERLLARLFFGLDLPLEGLIETLSTGVVSELISQAVVDKADLDARCRTREILCLTGPASAADRRAADAARSRVWGLTASDIAAFGSVDRLAFAIWEARGCGHGQDWRDWFAAETALQLCSGNDVEKKMGLDALWGDDDRLREERTARHEAGHAAVAWLIAEDLHNPPFEYIEVGTMAEHAGGVVPGGVKHDLDWFRTLSPEERGAILLAGVYCQDSDQAWSSEEWREELDSLEGANGVDDYAEAINLAREAGVGQTEFDERVRVRIAGMAELWPLVEAICPLLEPGKRVDAALIVQRVVELLAASAAAETTGQ
jgi:hypothetical protein